MYFNLKLWYTKHITYAVNVKKDYCYANYLTDAWMSSFDQVEGNFLEWFLALKRSTYTRVNTVSFHYRGTNEMVKKLPTSFAYNTFVG